MFFWFNVILYFNFTFFGSGGGVYAPTFVLRNKFVLPGSAITGSHIKYLCLS